MFGARCDGEIVKIAVFQRFFSKTDLLISKNAEKNMAVHAMSE